jgi:hypothetical protein
MVTPTLDKVSVHLRSHCSHHAETMSRSPRANHVRRCSEGSASRMHRFGQTSRPRDPTWRGTHVVSGFPQPSDCFSRENELILLRVAVNNGLPGSTPQGTLRFLESIYGVSECLNDEWALGSDISTMPDTLSHIRPPRTCSSLLTPGSSRRSQVYSPAPVPLVSPCHSSTR